MMTREKIESILIEYGVPFTDALADRLLEEFQKESYLKNLRSGDEIWIRDMDRARALAMDIVNLGYDFRADRDISSTKHRILIITEPRRDI